jgi:HSP20 family protein
LFRGEKRKSEEVKERRYYRSERTHGTFCRRVDLPLEVQGRKVTATFKVGVLEVRFPKTEEAKRKEHTVKIE